MKRNIGSVLALYPTPAVVIGTMMEDKPAWLLAGHVGIIGHDRIMVSLYKPHHTNQGIRATDRLSVNVVDENDVFVYHIGEAGTPVIDESPLVMECEVVDNYETETFDNFICKINATHVEEDCLNENGKVDYNKLKPVLFEMPTYSYLRTGEMIDKCTRPGKEYREMITSYGKRICGRK